MLTSAVKVACAAGLCGLMVALSGCACGTAHAAPTAKAPCKDCEARNGCVTPGELTALLPPNAKPGECYAKEYIPAQYRTVKERVQVREASEQVEIVPAKYEWVEEKICVKDASCQLEVAPAEFATRDQTYQVAPAHTDWEVNKDCLAATNQPSRDVYCLVNHPPVQKTVQTQCLVAPPRVHEVAVPAEFQTVRRQKLVCPATTRKITIPAEYTEIDKTMKVCDARVAWKRVECTNVESEVSAKTSNPPAPTPAVASSAQTRATESLRR